MAEIKKIGVVTTSFPQTAKGYAGIFVRQHVGWLKDNEIATEVVAAGNGANALGVRRVRHDPALFYSEGAPDYLAKSYRGYLAAATFSGRLFAEVRRAAKGWRGGFAHWLVPSSLAIPRHLPLVAIAHSGDVHLMSKFPMVADQIFSNFLSRQSRIVFVSQGLKNRAISLVRRKSRSLLHARSFVCPMGASVGIAKGDPTHYLYLGRLTEQKGVRNLLSSYQASQRKYPLVVAGTGPLRENLERDYRAENVKFVGAVSGEQKDRLFSNAAALIVPSKRTVSGRSEGTPTVVLEALSRGVPVIASATGGLVELPVTHYVPTAADGLANAFTKFESFSRNSPAFTNFSWDEVGPILWRPMAEMLAN